MAMIGSTYLAERRILELVEKHGVDRFNELAAQLKDVSEARMRRAIQKIPDGEYTAEGYLEDDGVIPDRPWKILAVTFTNKAARELRGRCERLVGAGSDELQVRTFHGFCSRVLRSDGEHVGVKPEFTIYDDDDQARVARRILDDLDIDSKQFPPRALLSATHTRTMPAKWQTLTSQ